MSNRPMGFGPNGDHDRDDDDNDPGSGGDEGGEGGGLEGFEGFAGFPGFEGLGAMPGAEQFSELFAQLLGSGAAGEEIAKALGASSGGAGLDPATLQAVMTQLQSMMASGGDGPVNWTLATDIARQTVSAAGDSSVGEADRRAVAETLRLADLWLDPVTTFTSAGARALTWSRAEWVEGTLPIWHRLVEPVAESVSIAMAEAMAKQAPPEFAAMTGAAAPMIRQMGGSVFGLQVGQAIGALASEVVSGTEVGLPLVADGAVALLPANIAAFGEGLDLPADEVRLYLGLREAARARLFAHVPWLGPQLLGAVEAYARGITIDTDAIEAAIRDVDGSDPASIQQALTEGLFEPHNTPAQEAALLRLETLLALVEGWVEVVADDAARPHLPHADALRETVRRRRAAGGPAEHTFASLVGLDLRPRRLREAAALWAFTGEARGTEGRDGVWAHPDLLPTSDDLDDPAGFATRSADEAADSADVDAAIAQLLAGDSPAGDTQPPPGEPPAGDTQPPAGDPPPASGS